MARVHNRRERRLFKDLGEKNRLSAELRRVTYRMRRWQDRMKKRRGKRWQAQYRNSLQRAAGRLEVLERELLVRAEKLKLRIQDEFEVSVEEVSQFEEQYKKEVQELVLAEQELREAQEAVVKAESAGGEQISHSQKTAELLSELQRRHRHAELRARAEAKDVKAVEREIASEVKDKDILTQELHRIVEEIQTLRQV